MNDNIDFLAIVWDKAKEYISIKDRQIAADHIVSELVDNGIDEEELKSLAIDKFMINAIRPHIDIEPTDDEE